MGLLPNPGTVLAHAVWLDPPSQSVWTFPCDAGPQSLQQPQAGQRGQRPRQSWLGRDVWPVRHGRRVQTNRLDIWGEMRTAAFHRGVGWDPHLRPGTGRASMATLRGGAGVRLHPEGHDPRGLGGGPVLWTWTGRTTSGRTRRTGDACSFMRSSADVVGTMVNGKWLYRNGDTPTLDSRRSCRRPGRLEAIVR